MFPKFWLLRIIKGKSKNYFLFIACYFERSMDLLDPRLCLISWYLFSPARKGAALCATLGIYFFVSTHNCPRSKALCGSLSPRVCFTHHSKRLFPKVKPSFELEYVETMARWFEHLRIADQLLRTPLKTDIMPKLCFYLAWDLKRKAIIVKNISIDLYSKILSSLLQFPESVTKQSSV